MLKLILLSLLFPRVTIQRFLGNIQLQPRFEEACDLVCMDLPANDMQPVCMMFSRYKKGYLFFVNQCHARRSICRENLENKVHAAKPKRTIKRESFEESLKTIMIIGHCFGLMPVDGLINTFTGAMVCYPNTNVYEGFVKFFYPWVFKFLPYTTLLGMITQGKYLSELFWRSTREDYGRATQLVRKIDEIAGTIVTYELVMFQFKTPQQPAGSQSTPNVTN
ncbi:hypothetical protein MSG28_000602 [Choristoneura fumiferana]|uniref:Uncharacterized protein n=1 Tax=Choristoneura fumiferana TaxID=7141 RepID=A0ACC0K1L7_CHOFU|nr:hypothetical protein MSG28_000602 [Choristoneura fumiferana]